MGESTTNSIVNIDLASVASIINNVIDKFAKAAGWMVTPRGSRKELEKAVEIYIQEIENDKSLPPLVKAAKITAARKEIKEYCNVQDIMEHAREFGQTYNEYNDDIDEDWAMFFYDRAKNVSLDDAKVLWGKILAEECKMKGKISKSLIHILSVISQEDAKAFENLCNFAPNMARPDGSMRKVDPIISGDVENALLNECGLTYEALQNLEALGLLHLNTVDVRLILEGDLTNGKVWYEYFGDSIYVEKLKKEFPCGNVILTRDGKILSELIVEKKLDGFTEYLKKYYEDKGYVVKINKED